MIIQLYRGLLDILIKQNLELETRLIDHIRPFHVVKPLKFGEIGFFNGFWNFLLEICMILFSKFIFITGIILITTLAIIFFPLDFIIRVSTFAAKDGDYQLNQTEIDTEPKIEPKMESPTQEKK